MIAKVKAGDGIRYLALCEAGEEWAPIEEPDPGKRGMLEAAQVCASHLASTITRARTAAHKARECSREGRAETARAYLDLACEHLDTANTNAARLLDRPEPEDVLTEGIELAQPDASPDVLFMEGVLALSWEIYEETGRSVSPRTLRLISGHLSALADEMEPDNDNNGGSP